MRAFGKAAPIGLTAVPNCPAVRYHTKDLKEHAVLLPIHDYDLTMAANYSPEQLAALAKEDQGPLTISLIIAFTVIAFVCVLLRGVSRIKLLGRALGWEDYTIILSMGLSVAAGVFQVFRKLSARLIDPWLVLRQSRKPKWHWQTRRICTFS